MAAIVWDDDGLTLAIHAQPGARQSGFAGLHGDALKVRLQAPAQEGRANRELCRFLASAFGVAASQVELLQGIGSRQKRVHIRRPQRVPDELAALLQRQ